ncbi:MAG: twitch domain-containing radical SAM protein [Mesorhizobium sp.]|uniref:twitch domain-containing radical SAM protein n=1 Tax=Mesorhizobium sp. TaxID=1871066 RepID=UPI000FE57FE4|nr:twitch domain-containing radical SAM protein [Mesorhizobium sp.]RWC10674.1 MAG: twitch domain-containing radical SAM protein [Mesorhizobium sp.]
MRELNREKDRHSPGSGDGFCVMPWINLHVATDGAISPCCEFDGSIGHVRKEGLKGAWSSEALQQIRHRFARQEPVGQCWKCFDRDEREGDSLRQQMNRQFSAWHRRLASADEPFAAAPASRAALDVRFSNLCNFKCRSCWHGASSKWFTDGRAIGVTAGDKAEIKSFASATEMMDQMSGWIDNIESIYFAGGEPLLMEEHYRLLDALIEAGRTHVSLRYNTNMSVTGLGGRSIFQLWNAFENVSVQASVDDTGARGALIRHGFDWPLFVDNIIRLRRECPGVDLEFGITVSALNVSTLVELLDALRHECEARASEIHMHSLQEPKFMRTQVLPQRQKRKIEQKLRSFLAQSEPGAGAEQMQRYVNGVIGYMRSEDLASELPRLAKRMDALDRLRSESTSNVLTEIGPILVSAHGLSGTARRFISAARRAAASFWRRTAR